MKVIKQPDTSGWKFEHTCSTCDAVLQVEASDVKYTYNPGDFRDPGYESYYAYCACCSTQFNIPEGKLTKAIKHQAKQRGSGSGGGGYFDR